MKEPKHITDATIDPGRKWKKRKKQKGGMSFNNSKQRKLRSKMHPIKPVKYFWKEFERILESAFEFATNDVAAGWEIIIYDQGGTASEARDVDCVLPNSVERQSKLSRARQSIQTRRQIPLGNNVRFLIHNSLLDPTSGGSN